MENLRNNYKNAIEPITLQQWIKINKTTNYQSRYNQLLSIYVQKLEILLHWYKQTVNTLGH